MKKDNFEKDLPEGYELKLHIDAKDKKTTIIYLVLSLVPVIVTFVVALLIVIFVNGWNTSERNEPDYVLFITLGVTCVIVFLYMILHEIVHGITYKSLTGAKLTFGLRWNVAFCGVPEIYVYRKAVKLAVLMPFIIFNVIFAGLTVGMYFINDIAFLAASLMLGLHIGGCVGDLHVAYLLDHQFKDNKTLIRDTGPEQFFYTYTGIENNK